VHDTLDSLNGNCQKQDCTHWHNYTLLSWHIQLTASRKKTKKKQITTNNLHHKEICQWSTIRHLCFKK